MAIYNRGSGDTDAFDRRKEVGANCSLELPGIDGETAITNVSFSEEANTSEVQYNSGFSQNIAVTGVSYSGSFEIPGNANTERDVGWEDGDDTTIPKNVGTMTIVDGENREYSFENVIFNSHSKDIPSDDRTTQSFDFMAETVITGTGDESE